MISIDNLLSLEKYAKERLTWKQNIIAHRRKRSVLLGEHINLQFEDEKTIRYQIQEMLRIEKIFEEAGIQSEIDAYLPLVPTGCNLKATMLIEYPDATQRRTELAKLIDIQNRVFIQVGESAPVWAIADEDLDRETAEKTSAVHFLRFEFTPEQIKALRSQHKVVVGIEHPHMNLKQTLDLETQALLAQDFQ